MSPEAYSALPQSEKENGTIYFVHQDAGETTISGTFTTGSTQYEKVIVDCGFKPTSISVILPFSNGDTYAEYDETISTTTSTWEIPMESRTYTITLGSETGESGITDILDNGFKFRCNASNTRNVNCTFEATGVLDNEINKIYYMGDEYTNGGSSGDGDGYKLEKIFDGNVTTAGNITLTKSINNYDELLFVTNFKSILSESYISIFNVDVSIFKNIGNYTATRGVLLNDWSRDTRYAQVKYVDNTTIDVEAIQVVSIVEIYGVKHSSGGGGGSTVVPNPQEEPTDTLNTIEIDGVVYDIEGGSEGEGVEIYSEDEYIVGKWIDGKKLYQKSIKFSATSLPASWTTIEQGVDYNLAFPEVQGLYYTSSGEPFTQSTRVFVQNGELKIQPLKELDLLSSTLKHVITIRYTKTVETPAPAWGGSVTNNYANFIDTNNIIDSGVYNPTTPLSYTATEDCFVVIALIANNNPCIVSVDNKEIYRIYDNGIGSITVPVPMKKGQTITATTSYRAEDSPYTVYGITYGSGGSSSGSSVEYSTEEKEVGTWIDGSKIYERTWNFSSPLLITSGSWSNTSIAVADTDIYIIVDCEAISSSGARWTYVSATTDLATTTYVRLLNARSSADVNVKYLTLRYTKAVS